MTSGWWSTCRRLSWRRGRARGRSTRAARRARWSCRSRCPEKEVDQLHIIHELSCHVYSAKSFKSGILACGWIRMFLVHTSSTVWLLVSFWHVHKLQSPASRWCRIKQQFIYKFTWMSWRIFLIQLSLVARLVAFRITCKYIHHEHLYHYQYSIDWNEHRRMQF